MYFGETQIQSRLLHRGAACGHGRFGGQLRLRVSLELASRNGIRLGFRDVATDVERGIAELCLCLCELRLRLVQHGLEWTRIDLKEHVVLMDQGTFPIILLDQVPADLRLNLRVDIPIERRHPLAIDADVPLDHPCDLPLRRSPRGRFRLGAPSALNSDEKPAEKSISSRR